MIRKYQKSNVVIIGFGKTGLSCLNFFLIRGVIPKIIDTRQYPSEMKNLPSFVEYCFGRLNDFWILNANLIVVSPGVRLDHPIIIEAMKLGIEVVGDIELFVREISAPIIAITGSNGKSTVTQLVSKMAKQAGWSVGVAGNIGVPVLSLLKKQYELYVLEISSFQLDVTYSLRATAATILNISVDHMDRYPKGLEEYICSKKRIYHNSYFCVVNDSDPLTKPLLNDGIYHVSFSMNSKSADYRLEYYKGNNWIVANGEYVLSCAELKINNCMNYMNMLSALALSDIVKIPRIVSLQVLRFFSGLSHRFQLVYKNRNVCWINDSKATNVGATKEAINNTIITLRDGNLHLLLGGDGKLANFFELSCLIKHYAIHLYCFGKDGVCLTQSGFNDVFLSNNIIDAMYIISRRVQRKDIVLLSPACASLDQFSSFRARGNLFTYLAQRLG
ncbi:UDP-N-acetylmuramoyl-L-alanine:D-glutamate ligase [Candidatus Blochmanniella floridana]|uniref:UDP-N-acetylmuramoylalanine--D-glutamate ligase n=1 Tax=Blochmanniella floridana TaxID=203907 RepID=MURD_BLOFL|nr:RecName: Full=UDP-N-acetylmuramoylalanine--D-glutamate ligase; AltName: Full=D-glutamic acid-adding enzyme; AltName: Full=UDP-N-acetylmuramoyl-L-alanyl-D-glutamate synthetase [Candidatus Blochmannia floridanus]CAD83661.1 UDP-N-acetylmuramoyl-L-alanine:D-glutamate ligase [Candidatus Blochmannia floridanus]